MANEKIVASDIAAAINEINRIRGNLGLSQQSKSGPSVNNKIVTNDTAGLVDLINDTVSNDKWPVTKDGKPAQSQAAKPTAGTVAAATNKIPQTIAQAYQDQTRYTRLIQTRKNISYDHTSGNSKTITGNSHKVTSYTHDKVSGYTHNSNTSDSISGNSKSSTSYSQNTYQIGSCSQNTKCGNSVGANSASYAQNTNTYTSNSTYSQSTTGNSVSTTQYSDTGAASYSHTSTSNTISDAYRNTTNYDHTLFNSITG